MDRVFKSVKFELRSLLKSTVVFLVIFTAFFLFFSILFSAPSVRTGDRIFGMDITFAAMIFIFVCLVVSYGSFFNNLMMFGCTRKNILSSLYISSVILAAFFSILSLLVSYLNVAMSNLLNFQTGSTLNVMYGSPSGAASLFFIFSSMLALCGASLLFSSLSYKFGKTFRIVFWVGFAFLWFLVPLAQRFNLVSAIVNAIKWFFGLGYQNGIIFGGLHLIVLSVILGGATYLVARRQPQKA